MKDKSPSFFSIIILALVLILLIVITQFFTNKSTSALTSGSIRSVETIRLNNSIQELVNLSFDLENKLITIAKSPGTSIRPTLKDSLTMLGYNASIITQAIFSENVAGMDTINAAVDRQIAISEGILVGIHNKNQNLIKTLADSLAILKSGNRVYENCIHLQQTLNKNLQKTLNKNAEQAIRLTVFNRILAIISIIAILSFATITVRRQSQQHKLIQELKAAELAALKSKQAKDDFLANMSHELRTPLNALIGFGNLLDATDLNKDQKEYVEVIKSSGTNLLCIVNDVLDLSKIEAGKLTIAHKLFNLHELFTVIGKMFSAAIKDKNLYYRSFIDDKVPQNVFGDPDRLQQVFINLINNAIKFTNHGGIEVSAGIVWTDDDSKFCKLSFTVKDTGIGIPKDKIEKVFERFEQLEHGAQRQHGGTGLGLTIVKNLVSKMGGAISVYSQENEGSEFNFTCLLEKSNVATTINKNNTADPKISFAGYKALIVEDNKANQTLLRHIFNKHQLKYQIADNGKVAIEILNQEEFDLVFMDIQMPEMDGYTAVSILRNRQQLKTPIIAMTAYVSEVEVDKCLSSGFTNYIAKPVDESVLIQKIADYLPRQPLQAEKPESKLFNKENLSFLSEIVGDDPDVIKEIVTEMQLQWEKDKEEIREAIQQNDITLLRKILHRMKSTFSSLGPEHIVYRIIAEKSSTLYNDSEILDHKCIDFINEINTEVI